MTKDLEIYLDGKLITNVPIETKSPVEVTIEYLNELYNSLFREYIESDLPRYDETKVLLNNFIDSIDIVISYIENKEGLS